VLKDEAQALRWYERAAAQSDPDAVKNLARLRAAIQSRPR
jgi:TPR repeat protein